MTGLHQAVHRDSHQHPVQRSLAFAFTQQAQQGLPAAGINRFIALGQIAPGGVDQHPVFGKVPLTVPRTAQVAGEAAIKFIQWKLQPGKIEQAGLAGALRPEHHVPGQFVAPALAAPFVHAGVFQGVQRLLETLAQGFACGLGVECLTRLNLAFFAVCHGFFMLACTPADKHHGQPPHEDQDTDAQQPRHGVGPKLVIVYGQQRPAPPHQQRNGQHQQEAPEPCLRQ